MRRKGTLVLAAALAMWTLPEAPVGAQGVEDPCAGDRGPLVREVVVPSQIARDPQSGVCMVEDGGTVHILPGTYETRITIVGKSVNLIGGGRDGPHRTAIVGETPAEVVPLSRASGLITHGPGGGGRVEGLALIGGDVGVLGVADASGFPSPVSIHDTVMMENGRGVAGVYPGLEIVDTKILFAFGNAISLPICPEASFPSQYNPTITIDDIFIGFSDGVGLLISNCTPVELPVNFKGVVQNNFDGGLVLVGNLAVGVADSWIHNNGQFGVLLHSVPSTVFVDTTIEDTFSRPECPGCGVAAVHSSVVVLLASIVRDNDSAGVVLAGATEGRFVSSDITGHPVGVVLQSWDGFCPTMLLFGENHFANVVNDAADLLCGGGLPVPGPPPQPPAP